MSGWAFALAVYVWAAVAFAMGAVRHVPKQGRAAQIMTWVLLVLAFAAWPIAVPIFGLLSKPKAAGT